MRRQLDGNKWLEQSDKDSLENKTDEVELEKLGSFMEIGSESKEEQKEEQVTTEMTGEDSQTVEETSGEKEQLEEELPSEKVDKMEEEESAKEESDSVKEEELEEEFDEDSKDDEDFGFLEKRRRKRERKLFERKQKLYIFSRMKTAWISYLPFIFLIIVLPWISYIKPPVFISKWIGGWNGTTLLDYILYQKSIWFLLGVGIYLLVALCYQRKMERKKDIILRITFFLLGIYGILTIVSSLFSQYAPIALWGAQEQREGIFVLVSYLVLCMIAVSLYRREKDYRVIFGALSVFVFMLLLFLVSSAMEYHLYDTAFFEQWKLMSPFANMNSELLQENQIYALTLSYQDLGSVCALLLPFFTVIALFRKEKAVRVIAMVMAIGSCILLFFSTSRAGIVGIFVSFLVLLLISIRKLFKHYKQTLAVIAVLSVFVAGVGIATNGEIFLKGQEFKSDIYGLFKNQANFDYHNYIPVKDISIDGKRIFFKMQEEVLEIDYTTGTFNCFDKAGQFVEYKKEDGIRYTTKDSRFVDTSFTTEIIKSNVNGKEEQRKILRIYYQDKDVFILNLAGLPQKAFLDTNYQHINLIEAPYFGFEGKEKSANHRGYVWSRTIPLLKQTIWTGFGSGSFSKVFPQGDLLAKWYVYGTPSQAVEKSDSWYLQVGLEQGLLALLLLMIVLVFYFVDSIVLYIFRKDYNTTETFGIAIFVGIIGYSVTALFVNPSISVSPLFWCLFGFGMGANHWVRRMREQEDLKKSNL